MKKTSGLWIVLIELVLIFLPGSLLAFQILESPRAASVQKNKPMKRIVRITPLPTPPLPGVRREGSFDMAEGQSLAMVPESPDGTIKTATIEEVEWGRRYDDDGTTNHSSTKIFHVATMGGIEASTNGGTNWHVLIDQSETNAYPFGIFVEKTAFKSVIFRMQRTP